MSDLLSKLKSIKGSIEIGSLIKDGPVSQIYACSFKGDHSVIRIDKKVVEHLSLNRIKETQLLQSIKAYDCVPEILYSDPQNGLLITRLIEGQPLTQTSIHEAVHLEQLAQAMHLIHHTEPKIEPIEFNHFIQNYEAELKDIQSSKILDQGLSLFRELNQNKEVICLCHNDLNHTNIIISNGIKILDWEYACLNNPYFDLATVIDFHDLSDSEVELFLFHYDQGLNSIDVQLLESWQRMSQYINMFWLMILQKYDTISVKEKSWMNDLEKHLS
tara:strand:- start:63 stop:881 length:819 start_codon:yes stop_codon:yes gene_type:complete